MTIYKAIRLIEDHMRVHKIGEYPHVFLAEALNMAIAALRAQLEVEKTGTLKTTWETPETCPNCMEHLSRWWSFCPECGRPTDWSENAPLTLEELREMDREPVWCAVNELPQKGYYCLCDRGLILAPSGSFFDCEDILNWVFYRRRPEGGDTNA